MAGKWIKPSEATARLGVTRNTLIAWANSSPPKIRAITLPNGYHRYSEDDVEAILAQTN